MPVTLVAVAWLLKLGQDPGQIFLVTLDRDPEGAPRLASLSAPLSYAGRRLFVVFPLPFRAGEPVCGGISRHTRH